MRVRLEDLMRAYGQSLALISRKSSGEKCVKAFLQPVLKERKDLPVAATPLGAVSEQRWLYIGPAGEPLAPGDKVRLGRMRLAVQETETVWFRDEPLYRRAVLRPEKEETE